MNIEDRNSKIENTRALTPPALAALLLLLIAAAGLYGYVAATGHHLVKPATPLRLHLYKFPDQLGLYQLAAKHTLTKETADELGAVEYLSRSYRHLSTGQTVTLHLSYHTGAPDARPHVSPRCYVAGGVAPGSGEGDASFWDDAPVRLFRVPTPPGDPPSRSVIVYTHIANGRWLADPLSVTDAMADPDAPAAWWLRIELLVPDAADLDAAAAVAADFLDAAVPSIMTHLPESPARP